MGSKKSTTRRDFIKKTTLAGLSMPFINCMSDLMNIQTEYLEFEALVIGSGFGGSVSALRLAQSGIKVAMVERGRSWTQNDFTSLRNLNGKTTWLNNSVNVPLLNANVAIPKYTGVIEYKAYQNMQIYNGAGLGGGSLVFAGTFVQPSATNFESVFPSDINYSELDEVYFPRVETTINISHIPDSIRNSSFYKYAKAFDNQVQKAGMTSVSLPACYDWSVIEQELRGEIPKEFLHGDGVYGTRNGAKRSLDKNYIQHALSTNNLSLFTLHEVVDIVQLPDERYKTTIHQINENGAIIGIKAIASKSLFMCAGAPNTLKLLLKAKATGKLPDLNNQIGKEFGTNGKTYFRRTVPEDTGTYTGWVPANGVIDSGNPHVPIFVEALPQPISLFAPGLPLKSIFNLGLGLSTYRGSFDYDKEQDELLLDWNKNGLDESINAAKDWVRRVDSANPGSHTDNILIKNHYSNDFTYHPLGGCVIGKATDSYGRLLEYPNLYVNDSTLIPGAIGANPAFTIAALAERNIEHIIREDMMR